MRPALTTLRRLRLGAGLCAFLCLQGTALAQDAGASAAAPRLAVGDRMSYRVEERADQQRHEATATVLAIEEIGCACATSAPMRRPSRPSRS